MVKNLESNYTMWAKIIEDTTQHSEDTEDVDVPSSSVRVRPYSIWRIRNRIQIQIFQIQWIRPFSARIRIRIRESSKSSFDVDSLAKPEVASVSQT